MRLLNRSEITPASGASTRIGPNCSPVVMPTAMAEFVGEHREHEPVLGDPLHPGAGVGDDRPGGPDPVIEEAEGSKGVFHCAAFMIAEDARRLGERGALLGLELRQPTRQPRTTAMPCLFHDPESRLGERDQHLPAIGRDVCVLTT